MISWDNNNDREDTVITFNQLLYEGIINMNCTKSCVIYYIL